ncbi:DUF1742-domain-containing protein [Aspergillus japonicus CBS 114.51]|uniref:DUF1742-domain-containing protein n=2 Tax=Aspergillus TaxID=5052 RepID=A0A2V5HEE0_ASPV1|nr:DUF1742-domain-containing protein [Aspergillus japonicus CBS 114.51]PYI22081.1 DUF1742-domain-containing protein [Aspergillus violaceofuscus CBS 115571]RAH77064.1 DUF1742-domain-containing protein [Aspergillus japonicus CBS 114.51]
MASPFQNTYHLRRVADTSAKSCYICYKPSTSVLITPDNKDFFYACPSHLTDRNFCSPIIDAAEVEAKAKRDAMAKEIEKVKKEYEERQARKAKKSGDKEKEKEKEKEKDKDKDSKEKDGEGKDDKAAEKERDDKKSGDTTTPSTDDSPRIFALHKNFYQMRIDRVRNAEVARRNRQRLQDPSFFPSVPSGGI